MRDLVLSFGAASGLLCIVATLASLLFGVTPLIFRSGSMEPAIPSGALAFARTVPSTELAPGDVVSVVDHQGSRVTHRVVSVDAVAGNTALLTLQGDANPEPDTHSYGVSSADRIMFDIPRLGYLVAWLGSSIGLLFVGSGAAVLVWIAIWPDGRRTSADGPRGPRPFGSKRTSVGPAVVGVSVVTVVGLGMGHVPGTSAVFTDAATARSGSFSSKAEYVPKIAGTVSCSGRIITGQPDPVALSWQHLGAPYQYRIILRDLDGRVWRTWDVTNVTAAAGATISYEIYGTGLPQRSVIWQYHAEVHTLLPAGTTSSAWRGRLVSQPLGAASGEDLNCSPSGERDGTPVYVAPPASLACAAGGTGSSTRATLTWPHLGAGYTYQVSVRNPSTGNLAFTTTVTSVPSTSGAPTTRTVATTDLTMSLITTDTGVVEIRSIQGGAYSTGFVAYQLGISAANGVTCKTAAPAAARSVPVPTTTGPSTTTTSSSAETTSQNPSESTSQPPDMPGSPAPSEESTPPVSSEQSVPPTTTPAPDEQSPPAPNEVALSSPISSPTGNYTARLVQSTSGPAAVITSSAGSEVYRTNATAGDTLSWAPGTDELRIEGPSGTWSVSNASGTWAKTAVVEPLPPPSAPEPPPVTEEDAPAPEDGVAPGSTDEAPSSETGEA